MLPSLLAVLALVASVCADLPHHGGHHHRGGHHHHPPSYGYCDATEAPACAANSSNNFCLEDPDYPSYEIKGAISKDYLFAKKYADVANQSADDLVQSISKAQEESFDYSFYTGASTGSS